jgi:hypothetical protein
MRLSRVCGLAAQQRVSLTLERFDDLTENDKVELFENSIQAYIEYPEELNEKRTKVGMKIISHAWISYKSRLCQVFVGPEEPIQYVQNLIQEDRERFVIECELVTL